ncbi:MAG: hypothetical protein ACN4E2_06360 [Nitrospinota bacterium]
MVDVTFVSGKKVYADLGYLMSGMSANDELLIFDNKIELKSGESRFFLDFLLH